MASAYVGRYAALYDLFYGQKDYQAEATFVDHILKAEGLNPTRRLLELACGTGSHAIALSKMGYDITAGDFSADMVAHAQLKAQQANAAINFRQIDMREISLPEAPFDAVYCLFDSIGYVVTNEALSKVFAGVHHSLKPDGLFIFEFWHAAAMMGGHDPVRVRRWSQPEGEIIRISETTLDVSRQLATVVYSVYDLHHDQTYQHFSESHENRYFSVPEMAAWVNQSGFEPVHWYNGFAPNESIDENTWHVVAVVRRS